MSNQGPHPNLAVECADIVIIRIGHAIAAENIAFIK
jgi:hypothetical protein